MLAKSLLKQVVLLLVLPLQLFSAIPAIYLNDLQRPFDEIGKPYLNPTLGFIFVNRLASQMRFYGCYEFGIKDTGARVFAKDKGLDGVFRLISELFPSTGGNLSTASTANNNFGKILQVGNPEQCITLIAEILLDIDLIRQGAKDSCLAPNHQFPRKQQDNGDRNSCFKRLRSAIVDAINEENKDLYPKYFVEQIILGFFWQYFNTAQDLEMLVNELICQSVKNDGALQQIPLWTACPFTKEKLEDLQAKATADSSNLSLEECMQISHFPEFFAKISPYANGQTLISNGETNFFSRDEFGYPQLQGGVKPFADCVETAMRQLVNIMFYNVETQDFNFEAIQQHNNPDLCQFYGLTFTPEERRRVDFQTVEYANNGSTAICNAWNCVVADLNHLRLPQTDSQGLPLVPVDYVRNFRLDDAPENNGNNNELKSGLLNFLNVLSRILNKPFLTQEIKDDILQDPHVHNNYLIQKIEWLLQSSVVKLEIKNQGEDLYGDLYFNIVVNNQQQNFVLMIGRWYSQLYNLTPSNAKTTFNLPPLELSDTLQSFRLLVPELIGGSTSENMPLIYYLYSQPILDNFSKLDFLKRMLTCPVGLLINQINESVGSKILQEIAWQDQDVFLRGWPIVLELLRQKNPEFEIVIEPNVNAFVLHIIEHMQDNPTALLRGATKNINAIYLNGTYLIEEFSKLLSQLAKIYPQLKILKLSHDPDNLMQLPALPASLEELEIKECSQLNSLEGLSGCQQLKKLKLGGLANLVQLPALPASLEELEIARCSSFNLLEGLRGCQQLKKLKLDRLENLAPLPDLPASLEELEIEECSQLSSLEGLSGCQQLKKLKLDSLKNLAPLQALPASLQELDISSCRPLSSLEDLSSCQRLKILKFNNLNGLTQLPALPASLEELEIIWCSQLSSLEGLRGCQQLKRLKLDNCGISAQILGQPFYFWPELTQITIKDINPLHIEFTKPDPENSGPTQGVASEV